jgi:hypothetical protein
MYHIGLNLNFARWFDNITRAVYEQHIHAMGEQSHEMFYAVIHA